MNEIACAIKEIIKDNIVELSALEITDDMYLISSGYIDSFDIIHLISTMEQRFGIQIPIEELDLEDFDTVDSIAGVIRKLKIGGKGF